MLNENLKTLRKAKGMSQEELAVKLNVVRQTVSKWEKGLSVPDSEMIIKLAETLDTTVATLLGETIMPPESEDTLSVIVNKLELINEQMARQAENRRRTWRAVFVAIAIIAITAIVFELIGHVGQERMMTDLGIIGGADGPTQIVVSNGISYTSLVLLAVGLIGIYRTKKDK